MSELLTIKKTAQIFQVQESTIRKWIWQRKITAVKVDWHTMIEPSEVERLLKQKKKIEPYPPKSGKNVDN